MKFKLSKGDQLKIIVRRTCGNQNALLLSIVDDCYTSVSEITFVVKERLKHVGTRKVSIQIINVTKQQIKDLIIIL